MEITLESLGGLAETHVLPIALDLLVGLVFVVLGRWGARLIVRAASRLMERSGVDASLRKFLADVLYAVLLTAAVIVALDTIGVRTTAVIAVLGAAGLAVGLALQGSLSNFAAGVMIIVFRPYRVGDTIVLGNYTGVVDAIRVFHTVLVTSDHRAVTIPNSQILAQPIENLTVLGVRRVDIQVSVEHGTDLRDVRRALEEVVAADLRVVRSPPAEIDVFEIGADMIKLRVRPWARVGDHAALGIETIDRIRAALDGRGFKYTAALQA
jgi:small conductance mechanosensitive channel